MFEVKKETLAIIKIPSKNCSVKICYLPGNASSENNIRLVKQIEGNDIEEVIGNFKWYNYLEEYQLINDTTLMMIIKDTVSYLGNRLDTVVVTY